MSNAMRIMQQERKMCGNQRKEPKEIREVSLPLGPHVLSDKDIAGVTGGACLCRMEHSFCSFWVHQGTALYAVLFPSFLNPSSKFKTQLALERNGISLNSILKLYELKQ